MVAEAFREPGERMPIGRPRRRSAWSARRVASVLLWNHNAASFGVVAADNFGLFVTGTLIVDRPAVAGDLGADDRARAAARRASTTR